MRQEKGLRTFSYCFLISRTLLPKKTYSSLPKRESNNIFYKSMTNPCETKHVNLRSALTKVCDFCSAFRISSTNFTIWAFHLRTDGWKQVKLQSSTSWFVMPWTWNLETMEVLSASIWIALVGSLFGWASLILSSKLLFSTGMLFLQPQGRFEVWKSITWKIDAEKALTLVRTWV